MKNDPKKDKPEEMRSNLVVISDTHCGCRMGLCPSNGVQLDDGGTYMPSKAQLFLAEKWSEFWGDWVPEVTRGEPFSVVMNGDAIDGVHHGSCTQVSQNLADQSDIAYTLLAPVVDSCEGRYYHIRGTEAHVGQSGQEEERLARRLGAVPNEEGQHARWELWARIGNGNREALVHLSHHIGTAGSTAYESSALNKELSESLVESAKWGDEYPDVVARAHRHRCTEVRIVAMKGFATVFTTPAWQLKTPFTYRIAGARQARPQIGGSLIRCGDEDVYTRHRLWKLSRSPEVKV